MNLTTKKQIMHLIATDVFKEYNSSAMAKQLGITRVGAFKALKEMEKDGLVKGKQMGKSKFYSIDLNEDYTKKTIELILLEKSRAYKRWIEEFRKLFEYTYIIILFGSITNNEKKADDIDLLLVFDEKNNSIINKIINEKNQILTKNIHPVKQTENEFKDNIIKKDKIILSALRDGIVLHGIDNFVETIKNVTNR
ncbi:MAG: nucleotidyltransferase domain-containing protein [archaeon]